MWTLHHAVTDVGVPVRAGGAGRWTTDSKTVLSRVCSVLGQLYGQTAIYLHFIVAITYLLDLSLTTVLKIGLYCIFASWYFHFINPLVPMLFWTVAVLCAVTRVLPLLMRVLPRLSLKKTSYFIGDQQSLECFLVATNGKMSATLKIWTVSSMHHCISNADNIWTASIGEICELASLYSRAVLEQLVLSVLSRMKVWEDGCFKNKRHKIKGGKLLLA